MQKHLLVALTLAGALSVPAIAADDHKGHDHGGKSGSHAHQVKPSHGGVVSVVKDVNYELVAKADSLSLFVNDHGQPVDLKGASARVTLLSGSDKSETTLLPVGDRLEAKGNFKVGPGTKAVAQVALKSGTTASVRFTLR